MPPDPIPCPDPVEPNAAEAELARTRSRLAETEALAALGSWEWDVATNRVLWSTELYTLWGVRPEELDATYEGVLARVHPDDRELLRRTVDQACHQASSYVLEHRIVRSDGAVRWLQSRGAVLADGGGHVIKMFGTGQDITERRQGEEALRRSRARLREFASRLRSAREQERTRIAREIHDELGQALTALKMDVFSIRSGLPPAGRARLQPVTDEMVTLIDTMIDKVRTLAAELRPAVLDSLGLGAAVEWAVQQFARRTGICGELDLPADPLRIDAERSIDLFRILQEALANVARHAEATSVRVHLRAALGELVLEVQDNGRGISPSEIDSPESFGLLGMRERALRWGGEIGIRTVRPGGTCATVCIPFDQPTSEVVA